MTSYSEMNTKYGRRTRLLHFERHGLHAGRATLDGRIIECGVGPGRSIFASLGHSLNHWSTAAPRRSSKGYDTYAPGMSDTRRSRMARENGCTVSGWMVELFPRACS